MRHYIRVLTREDCTRYNMFAWLGCAVCLLFSANLCCIHAIIICFIVTIINRAHVRPCVKINVYTESVQHATSVMPGGRDSSPVVLHSSRALQCFSFPRHRPPSAVHRDRESAVVFPRPLVCLIHEAPAREAIDGNTLDHAFVLKSRLAAQRMSATHASHVIMISCGCAIRSK